MPKATTIADYAERTTRVVEYIADHLDEPIDLERLAGVACFSPFHFHRIYQGMMRETVAATVRRLRLHRASVDLLERDRPIAAIAKRAGYGSVAAFTRAFRAAFGAPPAAFRGQRPWQGLVPSEEGFMYQATIRVITPVRVVAIPHRGDYQQIGTTFERLAAWAAGRNLARPTSRSFGIYYDDPGTVAVEALRADACLELPPDVNAADVAPDDRARVLEIPGGPHAVVLHVGPYADLMQAYHWLFSIWLPGSGKDAADRPCFEEYLNDPRAHPPTEWRTEISLPLASA